MTREDIIRMARECGYWSGQTVEMNDVGLERFAALIAAAEREACAEVCDLMEQQAEGTECCKWPTPIDCAAAIRSRSNP